MPNGAKVATGKSAKGNNPGGQPEKKKSASKGRKGQEAGKMRIALDDAAKKWLRILRDPCGADMCRPCYAGTGAGYLSRLRGWLNPPADAVDFVAEVTPLAPVDATARWGYSTVAGGSLGTAGWSAPFNFLTTVGRYRPVAGCVRVHYLGTELQRKGLLGLNISGGVTLVPAETIAGTAMDVITSCATTGRVGEKVHEVRWLPSTEDAMFTAVTAHSDEQNWTNDGASITVAITGMEPGTVRLELVFIYEWQPKEEVSGNNFRSTMEGPPSRNHLSEILAAIGDLGSFAVGTAAKNLPAIMAAI